MPSAQSVTSEGWDHVCNRISLLHLPKVDLRRVLKKGHDVVHRLLRLLLLFGHPFGDLYRLFLNFLAEAKNGPGNSRPGLLFLL